MEAGVILLEYSNNVLIEMFYRLILDCLDHALVTRYQSGERVSNGPIAPSSIVNSSPTPHAFHLFHQYDYQNSSFPDRTAFDFPILNMPKNKSPGVGLEPTALG